MVKQAYGDISVSLETAVAVVEINRPPNNHVSVALMRDLADALADIDAERGVRCT